MLDNVQRLTSSFAPFVIQRRWARWHAEIPYGYPCLSSTERNEFGSVKMMLVIRCWSFSKNFAGFFSLSSSGNIQVQRHAEIPLCWAKMIGCNGKGKCRGCPTLSFSKHWSLLTLLMSFLFLLSDRFRCRGYWPAEWCSTRTKLVSYLYFPFISNKRQVKRGNCHTLISFGDHLFVGMRPSLDHFEVLDTYRQARGGVFSKQGCLNNNQAHLGLPGCSNRRRCLLVEATQLAWASWAATTSLFSPIDRGRRAEQIRSTLLVSENHLKLVRKIVSVKKIQAEALS